MKKKIWLVLACFALICIFANSSKAQTAQIDDLSNQTHESVSILFLLDASWSMRDNDSLKLWKPAVQFIISELSNEDQVAIVQFEADGKVIKSPNGQIWLSAENKEKILKLADQVRDDGLFTDYRAGLQKALEVFEENKISGRRIVLLLSDGVLDPNPRDGAYSPHNLTYAKDILVSSRAERRSINEKYRRILDPIARKFIRQDIVPDFQKSSIEIFTVALGPNADFELMQFLTENTSIHENELHSFRASNATDLIDIFTSLLQYWSSFTVFKSKRGEIFPGIIDSIQFDQWVSDKQLIVLTNSEIDMTVFSSHKDSAKVIPRLHPLLRHYWLPHDNIYPMWYCSIKQGEGDYNTLWVGQNQLSMTVSGLKDKYNYGETVSPVVQLRSAESAVTGLNGKSTSITARIQMNFDQTKQLTLDYNSDDATHRLIYNPAKSGEYFIRFTAHVFSAGGNEVLPRPGIMYKFKVLPSFYVLPAFYDFKDAKAGDRLDLPVEIHSGLPGNRTVNVKSGAITWSRSSPESKDKNGEPELIEQKYEVVEGSVVLDTLTINLPDSLKYGTYIGDIIFSISGGDNYKISYSVQVRSWKEWVLWAMVGFLLLIIGILLFFVIYIWGYLDSPSGVLIPIGITDGKLSQPIRLSETKQGFICRWFHWRRNRVRIRRRGGDINLDNLPIGLTVELAFYHGHREYIRNMSGDDEDIAVSVQDPGIPEKEIKSGGSWKLKNKTCIDLGGAKFRYENIIKRR